MRTAPILVTKDQKQTKEARREKKKTSVYGCNFVYFYFLLCCFDLILYSFLKEAILIFIVQGTNTMISKRKILVHSRRFYTIECSVISFYSNTSFSRQKHLQCNSNSITIWKHLRAILLWHVIILFYW